MRALPAAAAIAIAMSASAAHANPLPPGAMQFAFGGGAGTGVDNKRIGEGYLLGAQASWQPMSTEQRIGWAFRWTTLFGKDWDAGAALIDNRLRTVRLDATAGLRFARGHSAALSDLRGGVGLLRSNEEDSAGERA